ncbi:MoaD/ThiS family protein [Acetohalobium arabaticum]|uniref:MoeD n=1 Tax=Acetohalobium arabaticum (strain ATCC 49924 / DSM 5501 / Z-7288) TaxID=574087 RepID=D9QPN9_ACEAZ|nr:MoaD/ThiS family protein [Acetohalobium arabaticum]ADL12480.1 MoeD [Acetohalobium arabaticum DSM 5501]
MKEIQVKLHGGLDKYLDRKKLTEMAVPDDATITWLYGELGLEKNETKIVLQNDKKVKLDAEIEADAQIDIYPIFGGG